MNLIVEALTRLNIKEYTLRGEPTTEDEFLAGFKKVTGEDSDGYAIETSDASKFGVTWSQIQTALANGGVVAMAELRVQRTMKLMESDWMANSDVTMSDAWKNYRTALRNMPANNTNASWDGETLGNVTWPTEPS
mgnify:FL=1|jgi:hypothetical protein|tara:strand:+ start:711 stop:1115 length:405 start_codon:yes stop_codon:yes gene_type:complete